MERLQEEPRDRYTEWTWKNVGAGKYYTKTDFHDQIGCVLSKVSDIGARV